MKCFYHKSDLDGHCSGALIKLEYPDCEMIGVDHGDSLYDLYEIKSEELETVFVVDFCFSVQEMDFLYHNADLIWIDHHKSAMEKMSSLEYAGKIKGLRTIGKAGCELTSLYLKESIPYTVELLGRYDVFDYDTPDALEFQYGMRMLEDTTPDNTLMWNDLIYKRSGGYTKYNFAAILNSGIDILIYQEKQDKTYAEGMSYEAEFEGLRAIVMNKAYCNSKVFDSVYDPEKHDIMVIFGVTKDEWKYSLYSDKEDIDVSIIAVKYGGGGHRGAAGFSSKERLI